MSKTTYRQRWMSKFEDACTNRGVSNEVIHGVNHEAFWASALFYFTQQLSPETAAERYVKVKHEPTELDSIIAEHSAKRNTMLAEPKNPQ